MPFSRRLIFLLCSWIPAGLIYFAAAFGTGSAWIVPETKIDLVIPFNPKGIWLYLLFYLFIPFTFFKANKLSLKPMSLAFFASAFISGILFFTFPSTIIYPAVELSDLSSEVMNFVAQTDTPLNCCPSLHGSLITICSIGLWQRGKRIRNLITLCITFIMFYAIIQTRRHLFFDLGAGIMLGSFSYWVSCVLLKRTKVFVAEF